jgi:hypothetical protein
MRQECGATAGRERRASVEPEGTRTASALQSRLHAQKFFKSRRYFCPREGRMNMADDAVHEAIRSLLVAAESLVDGQHPSSPDDVVGRVAADAARDAGPLLKSPRAGEPEWDALSELADALRLAVAARFHGSADSDARFKNLTVAVKHARSLLDGLATIPTRGGSSNSA